MTKHVIALLLVFTASQAFTKESRISKFAGYYTYHSNQPGINSVTIHFKADAHKEWGGYQIKDFSATPASSFLSYSFRNSRFVYKYWNDYENVEATGKVRIDKSTIRFSAITYNTADKTPSYTIKGTIRRTATGLILSESIVYFDSPEIPPYATPNVIYHSRIIYVRR